MRKNSNGKKGTGKAVAKSDLPSKVCVVCHRPFTWRKKWETVWDEVTTCSKSCNAKRRAINKQQKSQAQTASCSVDSAEDDASLASVSSEKSLGDKKLLRKQHKDAVKAQKREKRAKREGLAPELGRKPCDLCQRKVDLLVRCTVDETRQFKMICGKCWPSVSGGVPDGTANYPNYTYGGLWKNRNANLKKRIGSGHASNGNHKGDPVMADDLVRQIEESVSIDDHNQ